MNRFRKHVTDTQAPALRIVYGDEELEQGLDLPAEATGDGHRPAVVESDVPWPDPRPAGRFSARLSA